jgi:putative ABC transport system permease protein
MMIVMLMTSNTMTRIVSEERHEMGTLVSLGYRGNTIMGTYLTYILSADLFGSITGYLIGVALLPELVYNCFPLLMPDLTFTFEPITFVSLTLLAILLTGLVTFLACRKTLREVPAVLLKDRAPASSKHLFIEHFAFWKHLSFSWKITLRNFMRYKKRTLITIIASLSCALLILIGFGIRDGISSIGYKQYTDYFTYDELITLNKSVSQETTALKKLLDPYTSSRLYVSINAYQAKSYSFYVTTFKNQTDMIRLKNVNTNKTLTLSDQGVLITQRMAEESHLKVNDMLTFSNEEGACFKVKVKGICKNLVGNYMYMTPAYYKKIFKETVTYNTIMAKKTGSQKAFNKLLDHDEILKINSRASLINTANHSVSGLDEIVVMLVVISTLLATGVLYNLTSINISERQKEIATLKVLGFHNQETNNYVYREIYLAILIGLAIGLLITTLIFPSFMAMIEPTDCIFLKKINAISYLYTTLIILLLALILACVTYLKVNVINMIDALKSNE